MLQIGIAGKPETVVTDRLTAREIGSGELPVYATPALIALVEETAWKSVAGELETGQGTVGTKVDISHIAATPVGRKVRCAAALVEVDRRRLVFSVKVFDETGKVAEGTHERFVIENEKFLAKTDARHQISEGAKGNE